jgi:lipoprotein-releasing system permease protein
LNFSLYIARRYLFSKSKNSAINIITIIAAVGVFAGALALFIVLSGFSGLKTFSLSFTNEIDPDLKVTPVTGKTIQFSNNQIQDLKDNANITTFSKVIEERVLLEFKNKNLPAYIKGVDQNFNKVNSLDSRLIAGSWIHPKENHVVIGNAISRDLSLGILDYSESLKMMVPQPGKGQITDPSKAFRSRNALVIGIYSINEELNGKYVFAPMRFARNLLHLKKNEISAFEIDLSSKEVEAQVKEQIQNSFPDQKLDIKNRIQLNDKLYKMLNTENLAVYLIFTLVLIIALFNVGGAMVMSILDKRQNIKTLYNLGARPVQLKSVFFFQGSLLTFFGGIIGLTLGILIILMQLQFDLIMITPTLAYPVQLTLSNIIVVFLTIMVLGILASYIGSTRVRKVLKN